MASWTTQQINGDEQNLIYDDIAFLHFINAICVLVGCILFVSIIKQIIQMGRTYLQLMKIKKQLIYQKTIIIRQNKCSYLLIKIICFIVCSFVVLYYTTYLSNSHQLTQYNALQILNIDQHSTPAQIKKSFRKLALTYHPDKIKHEANFSQQVRKFIFLSKVYQCIINTKDINQEDKQKCLRFGSIQQQQMSYKFGIGMPAILLNSQYSLYFGIFMIFLVLVVVPYFFFAFLFNMDHKNKLMSSYQYKIINRLMKKRMNIFDFCIIYGSILSNNQKNLQNKLCSQEQAELQQILTKYSNMQPQLIQKFNEKQKYYIYIIGLVMFKQNMSKINKDGYLKMIHRNQQTCQVLIKLSLIYAKRNSKNKQLNNLFHFDKKYIKIQFKGVKLVSKIVGFCRQLFLTKIQQQQKQKQSKCQIFQLPNMQIQMKICILQKQVSKCSQNDILTVNVVVSKKPSQFLCLHPKYHFSMSQKYILIISFKNNLVSSRIFEFQNNQNQLIHRFTLKKLTPGKFNIKAKVMSLNYQNIDSKICKTLKVRKISKKKVYINRQDRKIQQIPPNFFQSILKINNQSEEELSDHQKI